MLVPATLGGPLGGDDLFGGERRGSEVPDLSLVDEVAEGAEGLFDVGGLIGSMYLVQVDVVGLQSLQAVLDLGHDPTPGVALGQWIVAHLSVDLRCENHAGSVDRRQSLADDLFGFALGVHVSGVDEVDSGVERLVDDLDRFFVVGVAPRSEHHGAETKRAYCEAGTAKGT